LISGELVSPAGTIALGRARRDAPVRRTGDRRSGRPGEDPTIADLLLSVASPRVSAAAVDTRERAGMDSEEVALQLA